MCDPFVSMVQSMVKWGTEPGARKIAAAASEPDEPDEPDEDGDGFELEQAPKKPGSGWTVATSSKGDAALF